ncbi:hypothetical protein [Tistrella sp.]|nr:hypothetical protein [Tistrella sp.]
MTSDATAIDPALIAEVESFQHRLLIRAGFDPETFAQRSDADEVTLPIRIASRGLRLIFRITGHRDRAEEIGSFIEYARERSREAPLLRKLTAERTARDPAPVSRYQRRDDHSFLLEIRSLIRAALDKLPAGDPRRDMIQTIDRTLLATAPLGRCDAWIRASADRRSFAITIDDEIVRLASQMGFLFAEIIGEHRDTMILDSHRAEELLTKADGPITQFGKIVRGFIIDGSSLMAIPPARPSRFSRDVMATFVQLAAIFILAHEYSHAHLGHFDDHGQFLRMMEECEDDDEEAARYQKARTDSIEAEADANARAVVLCVCRFWNYDPSLMGAAAVSILSVYDAVYRSIAASAGFDESRADAIVSRLFNHPSPSERLRRLINPSAPSDVWAHYVAKGLAQHRFEVRPDRIHRRWSGLLTALSRVATS